MRALLLFFQVSKLGEVFVQVDLVADGHDDIAEHGFVFAVLVADVGQFAFKAEDIGQDVFQLINHVVVGCLGVVAGPLQLHDQIRKNYPEARVDLGSCHALCNFYAEEGGLMIGVEI